jgi:hypothetical protein
VYRKWLDILSSRFSSAISSADHALINLNGVLAPDAIALSPNHPGPQFMENLKGGFMA